MAETEADQDPPAALGMGPGPDPDMDPDMDPGQPAGRSRLRRLLAPSLLVVGLVACGAVAGWWLGADRDLVERDAAARSTDAPPPRAAVNETTMPDLRGLPLGASRQILADLGVPAAVVRTQDRPAAGEVGVVVDQSPVYGYAVDEEVRLTVSSAATVPAVRGRDATAVLSELEQLGAQVRTSSSYVPGAEVGSIASIRPAPGRPLPDEVQVVVATQPDEVDLTTLESVDGGCYTTEDLQLNGETFPTGLSCEAYPAGDGDPLTQSYVVGRAAQTVAGVLGVPDDAEPGTQVRLQVLADGRVVREVSASYGAPAAFSAEVAGALRLTLRLTTPGDDYAQAGLGRLRIVGDPTTMAELQVDE